MAARRPHLRPDRDVDLARHDHERHAAGDNQNRRGANEQIEQVAGGEKGVIESARDSRQQNDKNENTGFAASDHGIASEAGPFSGPSASDRIFSSVASARVSSPAMRP